MNALISNSENPAQRPLVALAVLLLSTVFMAAGSEDAAAMDIRNFAPRGQAPGMARMMPGPSMARMAPAAGMARVLPGAGMARIHPAMNMPTRANARMVRMQPNGAFKGPQMGARAPIKITREINARGNINTAAGIRLAKNAGNMPPAAPSMVERRHAGHNPTMLTRYATGPMRLDQIPGHGFVRNGDLFRPVQPPVPCTDCAGASDAVKRYEDIVAQEEARLKALKDRMAKHQSELATMTDPGMRATWQQVIDNNAKGISETEELINAIRTVLDERRTQAREKIATHQPNTATPPATNPPPEAPPAPAITPPVNEAPPAAGTPPAYGPPRYTTRERTRTVTSTPRPAPAPLPMPNRVALTNPCPDHVAELTNSKRVFHRLYVMAPRKLGEQISWGFDLDQLRGRLEAPSRQANGSTADRLDHPSPLELRRAINSLKAKAQECEEVTIYIHAHGAPPQHGNPGSSIQPAASANLGDGWLGDEQLGDMLKGFRPNVSITVIMDSCYGGGFAGPNQVEESDLVQLIGVRTPLYSYDCPGRTTFSEAIGEAIGQNGDENGRSTTRGVKALMATSGWPLGDPADSPTDH